MNTGTAPTDAEITAGLQGGMVLPASFMNQQWSKTYAAIKEIQDKVEDGTIGGGVGDDLVVENSVKQGTGHGTTATTNYVVFGMRNNTANNVFVCGKSAKAPTATGGDLTTGDVFVIGNGLSSGARSNALRVTAAGAVMGTQAYTASGADFAEAFEWLDGNPDGEDRRGLFVTLDGEKIKLASANDSYVLGVVSATPTVIGDAHTDDWQGKYVTDVFGVRTLSGGAWQLSEGFDESLDESYMSRLDRPEWAAVGLVGKLIVVDDGSCTVNGYCKPAENGVATSSENGYRVMSRIDETHVKILLK